MLEGVRHNIVNAAVRRAMRKAAGLGDPFARLMTEPALLEDPYPFFSELRSSKPVTAGLIGALVSAHAPVESLYRDPRIGHRTKQPAAPGWRGWLARDPFEGLIHPIAPPSMVSVNPPEHTRYRRLVTRAFTVKRVEGMRPTVERIANELLVDMGRRDTADVMRQYAGVLPVLVIADVLGVPASDQAQFRRWGYAVASTLDIGLTWAQTKPAVTALRQLNDYFDAAFEERRKKPTGDLLSSLVTAEIDGDRLSRDELLATALILLVAGFETTVNLIGNGTRLLLDHPDQLALVKAGGKEGWAHAVEEILRYDPPVQFTSRFALDSLEVAGQEIRANTGVILLIAAANRDPALWADPDRFDVQRAAMPHLSFASGIHFCLGAALSRLEGQIALEALFATFPRLRLTGNARRRPSRLLRGYNELPVSLV